MLNVRPGEHGSTFGGNPVAARVAMAAVTALREDGMIENARAMGERLDAGLKRLVETRRLAVDTRGRGLLRALVIEDAAVTGHEGGALAYEICLALRDHGVLAKPTQGNIIRLAPPLIINEAQLDKALVAFDDVLALWE